MRKWFRKLMCKWGKHAMGPYEGGFIEYKNLPGKSQPVKAYVKVRECLHCPYEEPGPQNGAWQ